MSEVVPMDRARYDLTLIKVRPRTAPAALQRIERCVGEGSAPGELLACLYSEIGVVNLILLLKRYDDMEALLAAREAMISDPDPFGVSEISLDTTMNVCAALPGLPPLAPVMSGPFFLVRTETTKPGRLSQVLAQWKGATAGGMRSLPLAGLYSIAGEAPSVLQIWPGAGLDEGAVARATDPWPRADADDFLTCRSDIFRAASFSPIR